MSDTWLDVFWLDRCGTYIGGCRQEENEVAFLLVTSAARFHPEQEAACQAGIKKHGSWKEAYGYRFESPDLTIVISGDTVATESIVKKSDGCDVLIHEVYCQKNFDELPEKWQEYHSSFHTSSADLAQIANKVKPRLLILYHQLHFSGSTPDDLLEEIGKIYKGKVVYGRDLDIF